MQLDCGPESLKANGLDLVCDAESSSMERCILWGKVCPDSRKLVCGGKVVTVKFKVRFPVCMHFLRKMSLSFRLTTKRLGFD